MCYMGPVLLVLYVYMLYGLRGIVGANKRPAASAWQICRLLLRDYAIKLAVYPLHSLTLLVPNQAQ